MTNLNTSLQLADLRLPATGSLEIYLRHINQIPLLTQEEEHELALRLQKKQ